MRFGGIKVSTPTAFEANRPDLVLIDHVDKKWALVDFAVPFDKNVVSKEEEDTFINISHQSGHLKNHEN